MADHTEDALIREVDDELRDEQMKKLWQRYGGFVVGVAVLIVVVVAGYQGWRHYDVTTRTSEGESFFAAQALVQAGNVAEAQNALQDLAANASSGYGVMAQFQKAALMAEQGDAQGASALYQSIASETIGNVALSSLANLLSIMVDINAGGYDPKALEFRLSTLAEDDNPYRHSARELLGLVAMKNGETAKARQAFEAISQDDRAPQGLRQRATILLERLGS